MSRRPGGRIGRLAMAGLFVTIGAALLLAGGVGVAGILGQRRPAAAPELALLVLALAAGGGALALLGYRMRRLYAGLDRARGDLAALLAHRRPISRPASPESGDPDGNRLVELIGDLGALMADLDSRPDRRLAAVIGALAAAVVVVTESGQVSLINDAAKRALGGGRLAVGSSLYAALDRADAVAAAAEARAAGRPVSARLATLSGAVLDAHVVDLGDHRGTLYSFEGDGEAAPDAVDHDLSLHDRSPPARLADADTPIDKLAVVVLDTETTGLDVAKDRIVAIGAVRAAGGVVYRAETLDMLVNPGVPIPPRATRIHGIADAMVADAPAFAEGAARLAGFAAGRLVVGHNIGFDLAMLDVEAARHGVDWIRPPALDLLQIAAALEPAARDLTLDAVAARHGVAVTGRHTALGDALVTAELWVRMIPRLIEHGIARYGQVTAFAAGAREVIKMQRAAGW